MIEDTVGTSLLPRRWSMWKTNSRYQAMRGDASENRQETYTGLHKHRGDVLREIKARKNRER